MQGDPYQRFVFSQPALGTGKVIGQRQNKGDLEEFGRLDGGKAQIEPAAVGFDGVAAGLPQRRKGQQHQRHRRGNVELPPPAQTLIIQVGQPQRQQQPQRRRHDLHNHGTAADNAHLLDAHQQQHAECRKRHGAAQHQRIGPAEKPAQNVEHGGVLLSSLYPARVFVLLYHSAPGLKRAAGEKLYFCPQKSCPATGTAFSRNGYASPSMASMVSLSTSRGE